MAHCEDEEGAVAAAQTEVAVAQLNLEAKQEILLAAEAALEACLAGPGGHGTGGGA